MIEVEQTLRPAQLESAPAEEVLAWGIERFGERFGICTSFQPGGMIIIDMAVRLDLGRFQLFTIDTGRLPEATYDMIEQTRGRYGIPVEVLYPDTNETSAMVSRHGPNLFYESVEKRRLCCEVRKVRPLQEKLKQLGAWAVGLRREQSESRAGVRKVEIDETNGGIIYKLSPLADWSERQMEDYIRRRGVPRHPLFSEGYSSIGCAPCTRAAFDGEHARAGRWWWEQEGDKECGIHFNANGAAERQLDVTLRELLHRG